MPDMTILKSDLEHLYKSGKSMFQISQLLNCSNHKVAYWMKKYNIKRRSRSAASYILYNPNGDPFDLSGIGNLSKNMMFLFGLGLGIFWGEGNKTNKFAVRVGNTDPGIIRKFREFLIKVCRLDTNKITFSLICFNDSDPDAARFFWSKELKISPEKFGKITQIPTQGKGKYKKKSKYGVCTLYVGNIKLIRWILNEVEKLRIK